MPDRPFWACPEPMCRCLDGEPLVWLPKKRDRARLTQIAVTRGGVVHSRDRMSIVHVAPDEPLQVTLRRWLGYDTSDWNGFTVRAIPEYRYGPDITLGRGPLPDEDFWVVLRLDAGEREILGWLSWFQLALFGDFDERFGWFIPAVNLIHWSHLQYRILVGPPKVVR